jgi:hypothetical protein
MSIFSWKLLVFLAYATTWASSCTNNTSCNDCLGAECAWLPVLGCLESCEVIADTACYDIQLFPNSTVEDICTLVENNGAESDLCRGHKDCDTFVETILSDGLSSCQWFSDAEGGYCDNACGIIGCGDTVCSENITAKTIRRVRNAWKSFALGRRQKGVSSLVISSQTQPASSQAMPQRLKRLVWRQNRAWQTKCFARRI